jgi:membrane protein DedA with SNARE-associated domain
MHVFVEWVRSVGDPWAYPIVFAAAAAEGALFLGLVFPGETILLLAGFLAWKGTLDLPVVIVLAVAGAALGDSIGYELGRRYGPALRRSRAGRFVGEQRWRRAQRFMHDHGGSAVFGARFVTGPKSVVPALAGESRMPYQRFLVWNVSSAAVWGTFHVGIGYVAGPSYQKIEQFLGRAGLVLAGVVALVIVVVVVVRRRRRHRTPDR